MKSRLPKTTEEWPVFSKRLVVFLDFLGFSDAVRKSEQGRLARTLTLLTDISSLQRPASIDGVAQEDESYKITLQPEITTFSDNLVLSYPLDVGNEEPVGQLLLDFIVRDSQRYVSFVSYRALQEEFLIRGGIAFGDLYHTAGVVFGVGMVEAYKLESEIAIYPRVAISPTIYSMASEETRRRFLRDQDRIFHLNY